MPGPRRAARDRALALGLGSALAAGLGLLFWSVRPCESAPDPGAAALEQQVEWTSRQLLPRGLTLPAGTPGTKKRFERRVLGRDELGRVVGLGEQAQRVYDPLRLFRLEANVHKVNPFPEHPQG